MKFFAIIVLISGLGSTAWAGAQGEVSQSQARTAGEAEMPWSFAPHVGLTYIRVSGAQGSAKGGQSLGVFANYKLKSLVLEAGLTYIGMGNSDDTLFSSYETNLNYLAIPVFARKELIQRENGSNFYVKGGLIPAFLTSATTEGKLFGETVGETNIKGALKGFNLMASAGAGISYKVYGNMNLFVDVTYVQGLTSVDDDSNKTSGIALSSALNISI